MTFCIVVVIHNDICARNSKGPVYSPDDVPYNFVLMFILFALTKFIEDLDSWVYYSVNFCMNQSYLMVWLS